MTQAQPTGMLRRAGREPLLHFLLAGAAIFALSGWLGRDDERQIEVSASDIDHLRALAAKQWGREPDAAQLDTLVQAHVREEVLVREAIAAGLDKDDVVVRRRLAQKMDFLAQEAVAEPSEEELRHFHREHSERYALSPTLSFTHLYFSRDGQGDPPASRAAEALKVLRSGGQAQGDRFMLPSTLSKQSRGDIARDFGEPFADAVIALVTGTWAGPIESAHGLHLVRVDTRQPGRAANFEEVRPRVRNDLINERIAAARDSAYAQARDRYAIRITQPRP